MDEQTRLLTLAHLKNGKKPAEAAELTGVSYAIALKLRKELYAAEERNAILELFKLNDAALEILLESVRRQLIPAIDGFDIKEALEGELQTLNDSIEGGKLLNTDLQTAAKAVVNKITTLALASNSADTILILSEALCNIQRTFFSPANTGSNLPTSSFEKHLRN